MTGSEESRGALMPGVHRVIRVLDLDEGPYGGSLVTDRGSVVVLTDADAISGWGGWEHAGDEHVAGPLDLVRRHDGHDVLLPWCTERLSVFLGRRQADGLAFAAGEVSTLVGSMLRALDELSASDGAGLVDGDWWLTEDGRPMFVIGRGGVARESSALIVDRLHRDCSDRALSRLLAAIRDGLRAGETRPGVPRRQLELWEAELFAIAAPRAVNRETHAPARVRDIEMVRALRDAPTETRRARRSSPEPDTSGSVDGVLRGVYMAATRGMRTTRQRLSEWRFSLRPTHREPHSEPNSRGVGDGSVTSREGAVGAPFRRPRRLLVAGATAVVVLGAGLMWPGGATGESGHREEPPSQAEERTEQPRRQDEPTDVEAGRETPRQTPPGDRGMDAVSDPVAAGRTLLATIRECAVRGDAACEDAVAAGSSGIVDLLGGAELDEGAVELTLVDEYGDVAVIRASTPPVDAGPVAERMLVLVRVAEKWLVRDAYDVADQPG
ncbi:hypothetical protein [Microbacterium sp. 3J1]|uniref:hypothetical protein n=1 Tax=Microbacterium sp. 3J1 TaxID=861269 RepID=UPI0021001145|nr:hypothetical protein [Microbacterium sp. 3J1]